MERERKARARLETSAGGVIYRGSGVDLQVLLIRDAYAHWGLPKGHVERGESPEGAALREVREETGLSDLRLGGHLETIDWYFTSERGLIHKFCHFYLIEAPTGEAYPQVDEGITDCCWFPIAQAMERISYRNAREVLRRAAARLQAENGRAGGEGERR